jgi:hypothetical protein
MKAALFVLLFLAGAVVLSTIVQARVDTLLAGLR